MLKEWITVKGSKKKKSFFKSLPAWKQDRAIEYYVAHLGSTTQMFLENAVSFFDFFQFLDRGT